MRCPTCLTTLRVPAGRRMRRRQPVAAGSRAADQSPASGSAAGRLLAPPQPLRTASAGGRRTGGKRYGFNCGYCSSRLEATEAMAAQEGQCPTCGNNITIPILDRYGRLIDPKTRQIIKQDPHPVHAYAAAGERAPQILRDRRRQADHPLPALLRAPARSRANNCKSCGMPFTMEGTTLEATGSSNGFCVASLVLGIIGIPGGCAVIPAVLAIIFGIIGYNQVTKAGSEGGGKGMAIAGMICGAVGILWGFYWDFMR